MKFVNTEFKIKIAILAGTYIYFALRYYFFFNENPLNIINKENISTIITFFALKCITIQNNNKY